MYKFISLSILLLIAGAAIAESVEWAAQRPADLIVNELATVEVPSRHSESEPVRFAWPLELERIAEAPTGPSAESREYWVDASGAALGYGLKLPLSAPGAVIRVSALDANSGARLDAAQLNVELNGHSLATSPGDAGIRLVTGPELQSLGMPVPADTLAFQLPNSGEPRTLRLSLAGLPAELDLVVHVFEPHSVWSAQMSGSRHAWLAGQELALELGLSNGETRYAADSVQAVLVSPDAAHAWPLELRADGLGLIGALPATLPEAGPGLYEVHAYLQGQHGDAMIRRDLKIAVDIAAPSARLLRQADAELGDHLAIALDIEVASRGRYQVNGQVWGSDSNGQMQPLAMAQSAAVLEAGHGQITLEVPANLLHRSALSAPFEVRQIELLDQGRMSLIERHHAGLRFGGSDRHNRIDTTMVR